MDCHFMEKISLLIDGELGEEEAKETAAHLSACVVCQQAHQDFLRLRSQLSSYAAEPDFIAQRRALQRILVSEKPTLWRRSIRLPVPAFALLLAALVALGAWLVFVRQTSPAKAEGEAKPVKVLVKPAPAQGTQDALDLARFDRGERAVIYKVRRTNEGNVEQQ
jgi:anti-sigma factor RsiW